MSGHQVVQIVHARALSHRGMHCVALLRRPRSIDPSDLLARTPWRFTPDAAASDAARVTRDRGWRVAGDAVSPGGKKKSSRVRGASGRRRARRAS